MHKLFAKFTTKKVEMSDIVSPTPSKNATKVIKAALQQSYLDQKMIHDKATAIRSN